MCKPKTETEYQKGHTKRAFTEGEISEVTGMLEISNECFECSPTTLQLEAFTFLWRVGENSRNKYYYQGKTSAIFWVPVNLIDSWLFWPWKKTWISKTDPVLCSTWGSSVNTMRRRGLENFQLSASSSFFSPSLNGFHTAYTTKLQTVNVAMFHQTIWVSITHSCCPSHFLLEFPSETGLALRQGSPQCWDTAKRGQSAGYHQTMARSVQSILPHSSTAHCWSCPSALVFIGPGELALLSFFIIFF